MVAIINFEIDAFELHTHCNAMKKNSNVHAKRDQFDQPTSSYSMISSAFSSTRVGGRLRDMAANYSAFASLRLIITFVLACLRLRSDEAHSGFCMR